MLQAEAAFSGMWARGLRSGTKAGYRGGQIGRPQRPDGKAVRAVRAGGRGHRGGGKGLLGAGRRGEGQEEVEGQSTRTRAEADGGAGVVWAAVLIVPVILYSAFSTLLFGALARLLVPYKVCLNLNPKP